MAAKASPDHRDAGFMPSQRSAEHGFMSSWRSAEHGFTSSWRSAEHGFTSSWRSAEHGFTLVELMVVLALIGLAAAAVVLTLPSSGGGATAQATRFAARVATLRDRSVIEGRSHGLWVTASGYGFERRLRGAWQPLDDTRLSRADWRSGTSVSVDGVAQGRLAFDRVGLPDRSMRIAFREGATRAVVVIDSAGEVMVR